MRNFPAQYNLTANDVLYFAHIPKNAGMTFRTIIEDQFHRDEVCPATLDRHIPEIPLEQMKHYRLFKGHLLFTDIPQLVPDRRLINVTILREPIARVISHYEYIRRTPGDPHHAAVMDMTLEEFSEKLGVARVKKNIQTYHVAKLLKFDLDHLAPAEILDLAKESLDQCGFVGLVERFQDSLFLLSYIFGWNPILNTRKENAAKTKKAAHEIPQSTIDAITESVLLDIELYNYGKAIFEQRFEQMVQDVVKTYRPELVEPQDSHRAIAPEHLAQLLNQHYQQRYLAAHAKVPGSVLYEFAQPLSGSGWQRREYSKEHHSYRWIGPDPVARLEIPVQLSTEAAVEFRLIYTNLVLPEILDSLTILVNGQPIALDILLADRGMLYLQAILPESAVAGRSFLDFTFQVDRVACLHDTDPNNPDMRMLGLALNCIQVFPAHLRRQRSLVAPVFECPAWKQTADYLAQHAGETETVVAPSAFRIPLSQSIVSYATFLQGNACQWVVIHKGRTDRVGAVLLRLLTQGFVPVYANDVFAVYSTHKQLPQLAYTSEHVKPLYVDRVKQMLRRVVHLPGIRSVYQRQFKAQPSSRTPKLPTPSKTRNSSDFSKLKREKTLNVK